jgi:hypothetical protein
MGKENTISTGTTKKNNRQGLSVNSNSLSNLLPSSTYQFGLVIGVNPTTKEIIYNAIEDNVTVNKQGKALPLYKNKIQLPDIGYVVPLLRGPNTDVSVNSGQYSKTTYYLDPIGIWQTVEENKISKSQNFSAKTITADINKLNIKLAELGIVNNSNEQ